MRRVLPAATWREQAGLRRLLDVLCADGPDARFVGGAVRDTLLGLAVEDVDIATRLAPQEVARRAEAAGLKAVPTGIAHGTVTVVAEGHPYEVTTLRRDVSTDGRRATVAFSQHWQEDASRRDFTINALYADPASGEVFDWFGGLEDLDAGRVLFIGNAATRIDEDHLRMLRFFRFHARFGKGPPDAATLAIIAGRAAKLRSLSRERVADELLKLLALPDPAEAVRLMDEAEMLAHIAPECGPQAPQRVAQMVAEEQAHALPPDGPRRLIALLPPQADQADAVAARLKLSNRLRKRITTALDNRHDGAPPRALAYYSGIEGAIDRALLQGTATETLRALAGWSPPRLPLTGGDLLAMGVPAGPQVARLLRAAEDQWVAEGFPDAARVRSIAAALIGS